tara:strand:+ start:6891 stop:8294 length:1404 start_codon:yes stop_codon:yes gene_type:complete
MALATGFATAQDDAKDDAKQDDEEVVEGEKPEEAAPEEVALEPLAPGIVLRGERVILRPGKVLENASVHVRDGVIVAVGSSIDVPEGAQVIEGKVICAGFLDPWSTLGLTDTTASRPETDVNTLATDGLDLFASEHLRKQTLRAGVTAVGVTAGRTASVSGIGAVIRTAPNLGLEDAIVLGDSCVAAAVGLNGDAFDRIGHVDRLMKLIEDGVEYRIEHNEYAYELAAWEAEIAEEQAKLEKDEDKAKKAREKAKEKAEKDGKPFKEKKHREDKRPRAPKYDVEKAVWARVAEGELPLYVQAHRVSELRALLDGTKRFGRLRMVIVGGTHALGFAEDIAARRIPVVVWPFPSGAPGAGEPDQRDLSLAGRLSAAGVEVLLGSGGSTSARDLPLLAATAVGHGLDRDAALRALTTGAAKMLDVADRLGQVKRGLQADLLVLNGEPLAASTQVQYVLSAGQVVLSPEDN